jgi:hypothetical protein
MWYPTSLARDIVLIADERTALQCLARGGRSRAALAPRARPILRLAEWASYLDIQRGLGESSRTNRQVETALLGRSRGGPRAACRSAATSRAATCARRAR